MTVLGAALALSLGAGPALAACSADAPGVSRVMTVDTTGGPRLGVWTYETTLNLRDRETAITFEGGPAPGVTERLLAALDEACAKATFFVTADAAGKSPDLVRRIAEAGHTIGLRGSSGGPDLAAMPEEEQSRMANEEFRVLARALGRPTAPFFRFPELNATPFLEGRMAAANIVVFSTDVLGDDTVPQTPEAVRIAVLRRMVTDHGGMMLLQHDEATVAFLPQLLKDLKRFSFRLVHIVPAKTCPPDGCRI